MSFEERFAKWKQDGLEFRSAFRDVVIAVARKDDPDADPEDLKVEANHFIHDVLGWPPVEGDAGLHYGDKGVVAADMTKVIGQVMEADDRPVEWGNLFGEGSIDNTIQVSARGARILGEYHPEGITSTLLNAKQDAFAEMPFPTVVLGQATVQGEGSVLADITTEIIAKEITRDVGERVTRLFRPDSGIVGFEEAYPLKPIPSAAYERAVVASELWREIVADQDIGKTNSYTEAQFERLQEKYYGKVFLRVKINGLQVGVQHLIAPDTWVTL